MVCLHGTEIMCQLNSVGGTRSSFLGLGCSLPFVCQSTLSTTVCGLITLRYLPHKILAESVLWSIWNVCVCVCVHVHVCYLRVVFPPAPLSPPLHVWKCWRYYLLSIGDGVKTVDDSACMHDARTNKRGIKCFKKQLSGTTGGHKLMCKKEQPPPPKKPVYTMLCATNTEGEELSDPLDATVQLIGLSWILLFYQSNASVSVTHWGQNVADCGTPLFGDLWICSLLAVPAIPSPGSVDWVFFPAPAPLAWRSGSRADWLPKHTARESGWAGVGPLAHIQA